MPMGTMGRAGIITQEQQGGRAPSFLVPGGCDEQTRLLGRSTHQNGVVDQGMEPWSIHPESVSKETLENV